MVFIIPAILAILGTSADSCVKMQAEARSRVDAILHEVGPNQQVLGEQFIQDWFTYCSHSKVGHAPRAVINVARILQVPTLRFTVTRLLYEIGADARPALPTIRATYLQQRADNVKRGKMALVLSGPDVPTEQSLKCMLVYLSRGQHLRSLCRTLEAYRRH